MLERGRETRIEGKKGQNLRPYGSGDGRRVVYKLSNSLGGKSQSREGNDGDGHYCLEETQRERGKERGE